jgi:hypothetical protein
MESEKGTFSMAFSRLFMRFPVDGEDRTAVFYLRGFLSEWFSICQYAPSGGNFLHYHQPPAAGPAAPSTSLRAGFRLGERTALHPTLVSSLEKAKDGHPNLFNQRYALLSSTEIQVDEHSPTCQY